eukprot:scaffold1355_cov268-Pinguiococcus_pyrenoidosus.AAC.49
MVALATMPLGSFNPVGLFSLVSPGSPSDTSAIPLASRSALLAAPGGCWLPASGSWGRARASNELVKLRKIRSSIPCTVPERTFWLSKSRSSAKSSSRRVMAMSGIVPVRNQGGSESSTSSASSLPRPRLHRSSKLPPTTTICLVVNSAPASPPCSTRRILEKTFVPVALRATLIGSLASSTEGLAGGILTESVGSRDSRGRLSAAKAPRWTTTCSLTEEVGGSTTSGLPMRTSMSPLGCDARKSKAKPPPVEGGGPSSRLSSSPVARSSIPRMICCASR